MGQGGGNRGRGTDYPRRAPRRRTHGRQGGAIWSRRDALCREIDPAASARLPVAGASPNAGATSPNGPPARVPAARSLERGQVGSPPAVRIAAFASARGGDGAAHGGRDHASAAAGAAAKPAVHGGAPHQSGDRRG